MDFTDRDRSGAEGASVAAVSPQATANFAEVHRDDVERLAAAIGYADPALVLKRFDGSRRCFAGWLDGTIATYGWVSWGVECIGELERPIRLSRDEAYIWDCATLPPFRRRGLYSALLCHIAATVRDEGTHRLWIGASLQNQPSIRGFATAGFQPVITLTYVRLFHVVHLWIRDERAASPTLIGIARRALGASAREH
jgi:GNAT superfamily N-acetyltransferase